MSVEQPFDEVSKSAIEAAKLLQAQFHPERIEPYLRDEAAYARAVQQATAPRLPLSFPSIAHEINFLCIMALLDNPTNTERYTATSSSQADDAWSDVVLRGCMAAYISSSAADFTSPSNLLGTKGMRWSPEKVAELFNLSLTEMRETDHPTMPAVKIGERRAGRHASLAKTMSAALTAASRKLEQAGYSSVGEVVTGGFEEAASQGEEAGAFVVAKLLEILPDLGESYSAEGTTVYLHWPLIRLSKNILVLLERSEGNVLPHTQLLLPAAPDLQVAQHAYTIGILELVAEGSGASKRAQAIIEDTSSHSESTDSDALLRAATVAACAEVVAWNSAQPDQAEWRSKITAFGIGALLQHLPPASSATGIDL